MDTIKLTARKKHFDAAVKAYNEGNGNYMSRTCLVAQVVREKFPKKIVSVGNVGIEISPGKKVQKNFTLSKDGQALVRDFDSLPTFRPDKAEKRQLAAFRATLPADFEIVEA